MSEDASAKKDEINFNASKNEQGNPFLNMLFNIFLPILILNKGTQVFGAVNALILALAFPLGFGAVDWWNRKKTNFFSLLGLINIALTGGFALSGLTGFWFAVKEAAFPALIGIFVLASAYTSKPFIQSLFLNPQIINVNLLKNRVDAAHRQKDFYNLLKASTILLSLSFVLSALLNFLLASRIFQPLDPQLEESLKSGMLNEQIAEMTKWSFLVILLPSMAVLILVFAYLIRGLRKITGLTLEEIIPK
ncbi:MAG: VC0807 family protein [Bdellovibrionota bacterium]